jgi:AcrR family transcriptional regulator
VDGFLRAAASVVTDVGYDRATMCAIAERADSCIGSLYQFFPNKRSVAEALRTQYIKEIEQSWIALERQAAGLSAEKLVRRLVDLQIAIVKSHPAVLALLDVPTTSRTPERCELIRVRIASVLMAHKPNMSKATALRTASVVQQISKGLLTLFAQSDSDGKIAMNEEFKSVLTGYLVPKLK